VAVLDPAVLDAIERAQVKNVLLDEEELERRWIYSPDSCRLTFGTGQEAEQTILGNYEHPFYGVCVLNDTSKTIYIGFEAGQGIGSPLFCPPHAGIVWPARHVNLSLAVNPTDAAAAPTEVGVLRLQSPPPAPQVFPYGAQAGGGTGLNEAEVLKLISEHPGPAGPEGPAGKEGAPGKEGPAGPEGKEGKGAGALEWTPVEGLNGSLENEGGAAKENSPLAVATGTDGITHLTGVAKVKTELPANTLLFTLPEAHRPTKTKRISIAGASSALQLAVTIAPNGEVKTGTSTYGVGFLLGFDDISFAHAH
jgi:hypothetical protein